MSSSSEGLRRTARGRTLGAIGAALLAVSAFAAYRFSAIDVPNALTVKRDDLIQTVDVEGELTAERSMDIGAPAVSEVEFKIAFLVPEGTTIKKGEPVLGFDTETLQRQLAEKQAELAEAVKRVEQKEIDLRLKLLDLDQRTAQAEADFGRAKLKTAVPPGVQQGIELEKARLDEKGRARDIENLDAEKRATQSLGDSELRSLQSQRDRASGRVEELQAAIAKMTIKAPQDGIVVYRTNWRDEKKKVGDSTWFGEKVLALPDLTKMRGEGSVDEADGGAVAEGQKVTLRLEARPDLDLHGRIKTIGRTVRQKSWQAPTKVFKVEVALDETDPTIMRPAMRFRGEIETGRVPGLLLVPRDAVFLRESGPVVWARRGLRWTEMPVRLGRGNTRQVEVVSGLMEGDRVSSIDLLAPSAAMPRPVAGGVR